MKTTILIIDDEPEFLNQCAGSLSSITFECEFCQEAEEAFKRFQQRLYDVIVCDVLIPFRGTREGGVLLAREFSSKHPSSSIVLVSQYVSARWVNEFAGSRKHVFVEKGEHAIEDLLHEITRIAKAKCAFVCMPFAPEFVDVYELGIKPALMECGFKCMRCDEIEHNTGIISVVYDQIAAAHIVVADLTGRRANVCYEVGYAHGKGKEVILLTQHIDDLPFNLRGFNHIVYDGRITVLKEKLTQRLKALVTSIPA
jgi:CheY-like chemotaxis protein